MHGSTLFFPAASVYAVVALPLSMLSMLGFTVAFPGLATPAGHAHEMLFGFALAVVAGHQLGPRTLPALALLAATWLAGRVTSVFLPGNVATAGVDIAFPALLAWHLAPRLFRSAKKWRNQALPAVLTAICASAIALAVTARLDAPLVPLTPRDMPRITVALFSLLLLFMGGRLLAPVIAGQFYRQGANLAARVQPRIEGALIVLMTIAVVSLVLGGASNGHEPRTLQSARLARSIAGAALAAAGVLAGLRVVRWRLWALRGRPDLLCLASGYGWLAVGLVAFGTAHALVPADARAETLALHLITIGSLGTLTLNVMALTWRLKSRDAAMPARVLVAATLLLAAATLVRVLAGYDVADARPLLVVASACWAGAFALLLFLLVSTPGKRGGVRSRTRTPPRRA